MGADTRLGVLDILPPAAGNGQRGPLAVWMFLAILVVLALFGSEAAADALGCIIIGVHGGAGASPIAHQVSTMPRTARSLVGASRLR
jgi:hypothetical protein